eukprot:76921_1
MDPSFQSYLRNYQISSIVCGSFAFICCSIICFSEIKYRFNMTADAMQQSNKWLLRFALISILLATLSQLFVVLDAFPFNIFGICIYTTPVMVGCWSQRLVFFGLFQIKRLQLITAKDRKNYGKSKFHLMIKALYVGCMIVSVISLVLLCFIIVTGYEQYGCLWQWKPMAEIMHMPSMCIYLFWDVSTLISYIFKLSQYRNTVAKSIAIDSDTNSVIGDSTDPQIYHITKNALSKIVLLTVIFEILAFNSGIISLVSLLTINPVIGVIFHIWVAIDCIGGALMLFLMQKHNQKEYEIFMRVLKRLHCLVCCPRLAEDAATDDEKNINIEMC